MLVNIFSAALLMAPTAIAAPSTHILERRMTYRENGVTFFKSLQDSTGALNNAVFTVKSFSITDGQDPDPRNRVNDVHTSQQDSGSRGRRLNFSVGRKGDEKNAGFWAANIANHQSTFNHAPGKLNFAFIGELKLDIVTGGMTINWVAQDIALGQGRSGTTNNWWFGGKTCNYMGSESKAKCVGTDTATGKQVEVVFQRGETLKEDWVYILETKFI